METPLMQNGRPNDLALARQDSQDDTEAIVLEDELTAVRLLDEDAAGPQLLALRGDGNPTQLELGVPSIVVNDGPDPTRVSSTSHNRRGSNAESDRSRITQVSDRGEALFSEIHSTEPAEPDAAKTETTVIDSWTLEEQLLAVRCRSSNPPKGQVFFPRGTLERIITKKAVIDTIKTENRHLSDEEVERYAAQVCRVRLPNGKESSYRKIFAILIMLRRGRDIILFVDDNLCDADLPLEAVTVHANPNANMGFKFVNMRRRKSRDTPLRCLQKWGYIDHERFGELQWGTIAPFFGKGDRRHARFYQLSENDILPWIEEQSLVHQGGFSFISRVKIHPSHHNFEDSEPNKMSDGTFAIKHFKPNVDSQNGLTPSNPESPSVTLGDLEGEFRSEIATLNKFSGGDNPHLISLLAAYRHGSDYCLLFHWADSDLKSMWKNTKPGPALEKANLMWILEQCRGMTSALRKIHIYKTTERSEDPAGRSAKEPIYGRHGDIKPENILRFVKQDRPGDRGTLVITDFGLARFHTDNTRTYFPKKDVAGTPTYRPPECDMEDCAISRSFDIWSLGCVLLEFVAWYLGGWEHVNDFVQHRKAPNVLMYGWNSDQFFEIVRPEGSTNGTVGARVKTEVHQFVNNLHSHPDCSDIIHRLLGFIMKRMLVVESKATQKRGNCYDVYNELDALYQQLEDPSFQLVATPRPRVEADIPEAIEIPLSSDALKLTASRFTQLKEHTGMIRRISQPKQDPSEGLQAGPRRTQTTPTKSSVAAMGSVWKG
ncbi:kinase-like domain-containing protein [Lasiosphaeris hirsuta]|uniref:Kinase-like domain-containing protein n=1 Tax=Lasiosphaeris hirsuta TaxID=260670 RepID=A0AA40E4P5_9PEZI|nr:kinase-like domain-containing protein [Lasiosphaeris hirsuta]